jgi:hypothetical protein
MDLRQLQALTAIADHGSFSAAAVALHTVQSNVSSHVARLEKELGVPLVDRHAGQLTEEGQAVVELAGDSPASSRPSSPTWPPCATRSSATPGSGSSARRRDG